MSTDHRDQTDGTPEMSPDERAALSAELLELFYDCHENPEPLLARIAAEPAVAELFEEVRGTAEVLSVAARDDVGPIELEVPSASSIPAAPRRRWWPRLAVAAAAILIAIPLTPWVASQWASLQRRSLERESLRLVVSGPASTADGAPASFRVQTWTHRGEVRDAKVSWRVLAENGEPLFQDEAPSDGAIDLAVPALFNAGRTLEVTARADGREQTTTLPLGATVLTPLAHLTVDKPVYRPGEAVRMRAVLLDRLSLAPIDERVRLRVVDATGSPVTTLRDQAAGGVVSSVLELDESAVGGEWAFELRDAHDQFTVERLPFQVRRFQAPRLKKTLVLDRESYAPGQTGSAQIEVARLAGGPAAGATALAMLVVDGETVQTTQVTLDAEGRGTFAFAVPADVLRGEARVVARIEDRGVVETTLEPFVVPVGRVDVAFYPEGGDLVAGVENRVYAEVTDPLGRPVAARGRVVDDAGREVAAFDTPHHGRARFSLTPASGRTYRLELDSPPSPPVLLPAPVATGVTLAADADSTEAGAPLGLTVTTDAEGPWMVGAFCRGVLVAQDAFTGAGRHALALELPTPIAGVLRVTLFDASLTPRAERLVHRASGNDLRVAVTPADPRVAPGATQRVTVRTTDGAGAPVAAVVGLTVTDRSVRDLIGEPRIGLADQTWLFGDVRDIEDAGEFVGDGPDVARNIDLLLGTRGWRRFAWLDAEQFLALHGDEAKALLALEARDSRPRVIDTRSQSSAEITSLKRSERRFGRTAKNLFGLSTVLAVTLLLASAAAWAARRTMPRVRFVGPIAAAVIVAGVVGFFQQTTTKFEAGFAPVEGDVFLAAGGADAAPVERRAGGIFFDDEPEERRRLAQLGYVVDDPAEEWKFAEVVEEEAEEQDEPPDAERIADGLVADAPAEAADLEQDRADFRRADRRLKKNKRYVVREYAHRNPRSGARTDFTETVYWNPSLSTDASGEATVEFDVSDAATTWSATADAHGAGRVGQGAAEFDAVLPFRMIAKLPLEVTQGDRLLLPVALISEDPEIERAKVAVDLLGPLSLVGDVPSEVAISDGGARLFVPVLVGAASDEVARLVLRGDAVRWGDRVEKPLRVVPRGFPQRISKSGVVSDRIAFRVDLPNEITAGSLATTLKLYPSPLADIMEGMDGMLREPNGCFEQASSSNYPNIMALTYLEAAGGDDPVFERRARELLERGYAKITGYECSERGYEWFGGDPGHEALSAYGLLEFHDMARVYDVDREMVDRTREWVLGRRDGDGGFERNARALDSFGAAPAPVTDAYVTYSLAATTDEFGTIAVELDRLAARAAESDDAYEVALAACALAEAGRSAAADAARERLKTMQGEDGSLVGSTTSITSSRGVNLAVETTGWAALAWLEDDADRAHVERAMRFLLANRQGHGTFGATQATIVALKALTAYATASRTVAHAGSARVLVNDVLVEDLGFAAGQRGTLQIAPFAEALRPGANEVVIELSGGNEFPWAFDLGYHAEQPADHPDAAVTITTALDRDVVDEGTTVPLRIEVTNRTDDGLPMTLAIVGLPAGLEADPKILDDLKEAGRFDLWEIDGRDVVLYWRGLAPRASKEVTLDLVASIPGTTTGPASRAYLYYTSDQVRWAPALTVQVVGDGAEAGPPVGTDILAVVRRLCEERASDRSLELEPAMTWAKERAWIDAGGEPYGRSTGSEVHRASYGAGTFVLGAEGARAGFERPVGEDAADENSAAGEPRTLEERIAEKLREKQAERERKRSEDQTPSELADVPPTDVEWWLQASVDERASFLFAFFGERSDNVRVLPPDRRDCSRCAGAGVLEYLGGGVGEKAVAQEVPCSRCKTLTFDRIAIFR